MPLMLLNCGDYSKDAQAHRGHMCCNNIRGASAISLYYLRYELALVVFGDGEVQSCHTVEKLVRTHRLGHTPLLEELW